MNLMNCSPNLCQIWLFHTYFIGFEVVWVISMIIMVIYGQNRQTAFAVDCVWLSKLACSCHESCVFCICSKTKKNYVYAIYCIPGHDGSLYDCLLDSIAYAQSVDDKAVFVFLGDANAYHSWVAGVSLSYWSVWAWCSWFLQSVRLWAVRSLSHSHCWCQTRSSDDGYLWHSRFLCWYSNRNIWLQLCQLCASGLVICTGVQYQKFWLLKHRTNWDNICCAIRSFTWSTILKSADPFDVFDWAIVEVLGRLVPTTFCFA